MKYIKHLFFIITLFIFCSGCKNILHKKSTKHDLKSSDSNQSKPKIQPKTQPKIQPKTGSNTKPSFLYIVPEKEVESIINTENGGNLQKFSLNNVPEIQLPTNERIPLKVFKFENEDYKDITSHIKLTLLNNESNTTNIYKNEKELKIEKLPIDYNSKLNDIEYRKQIELIAETENKGERGALIINVVSIPVCGYGYGRDAMNYSKMDTLNGVNCLPLAKIDDSAIFSGSPFEKLLMKLAYAPTTTSFGGDKSNFTYSNDTKKYGPGLFFQSESHAYWPMNHQYDSWCEDLSRRHFADRANWTGATYPQISSLLGYEGFQALKWPSADVGYWSITKNDDSKNYVVYGKDSKTAEDDTKSANVSCVSSN